MTPAQREAIACEYLQRYESFFGAEPDADRLAKFQVCIAAYGNDADTEASLLCALETWLLHGPRIDHTCGQRRR